MNKNRFVQKILKDFSLIRGSGGLEGGAGGEFVLVKKLFSIKFQRNKEKLKGVDVLGTFI